MDAELRELGAHAPTERGQRWTVLERAIVPQRQTAGRTARRARCPDCASSACAAGRPVDRSATACRSSACAIMTFEHDHASAAGGEVIRVREPDDAGADHGTSKALAVTVRRLRAKRDPRAARSRHRDGAVRARLANASQTKRRRHTRTPRRAPTRYRPACRPL